MSRKNERVTEFSGISSGLQLKYSSTQAFSIASRFAVVANQIGWYLATVSRVIVCRVESIDWLDWFDIVEGVLKSLYF
jgi:hypothetical protein